MAMVPLTADDDFAAADRPVLDAGVSAYGQILHTWSAIGNSPGLLSAYLPFVRRVAGPGRLDQRIKELTAVRVAVLNHCRYTASHRCTSAVKAGVREDELVAVARGSFDRFDEREQVALMLAEEMTIAPPVVPWEISASGITADLRTRAQQLFDPAELVELAMGIGLWNALARFHRLMEFELDLPDAPAGVVEHL
ncbi:carboxymuconolactone decarboxylase family protein [Nocardioides humi]|uniref:Carboxymuconolactone decarboxylase-like domain-containing protein n=1 Tax=Nocardioides humi TaxID=449461 RepID=A0ABN2BVW7_9ACTN|nr:carboxymuconolactone decarboxylase family protein [Nocardioides humi]